MTTPYEKFLAWKQANPSPQVHKPPAASPTPSINKSKSVGRFLHKTDNTQKVDKKSSYTPKTTPRRFSRTKSYYADSSPVITFEYSTSQCFSVQLRGMRITEELRMIFKKHNGAYVEEKKYWLINHAKYEKVLQEIQSLYQEPTVSVEPIPDWVFKAINSPIPFKTSRKRPVKFDYSKDPPLDVKAILPVDLQKALYQFQIQGVEFAVKHHGRALIGDEMGVGKSIQALATAYIYKEDWPLLILAPSSLKLVWRDEIKKWLPMIPQGQVEVIRGSKNAFSTQSKIFIMSYDLAKNVKGVLEMKRFNIAIADEAHYLKNKDSKRSKILSPILAGCKRVILLSGTPILARPQEMFNIAHILRPDLFTRFVEFGKRYCDPRPGPFGTDWSGCDHPDELHLILSNAMMIRRLKSQVLLELPKKRRQKIDIEADPKIAKEIQKILSTVDQKTIDSVFSKDLKIFSSDQTEDDQTDEKDTRTTVLQAYTLTGLAKVKGVLDFVSTLLDNEIKFILFAQHLAVLDALEEHLKKSKEGYIRIDGSVSMTKRHELVKEFQESSGCRAALLSITASSQGVTLTAASTVVFSEFAWTPGLMEQAEDRAHRISQKSAVNIYYLYADHTLDPIMFRTIKGKNEVIGQALDGKMVNYHLEDVDAEQILEDHKNKVETKEQKKTLFSYFQFIDKKSSLASIPKDNDTQEKDLLEEEIPADKELYVTLDEKEQTEIASLFNWEEELISEEQTEGKRRCSQFQRASELESQMLKKDFNAN